MEKDRQDRTIAIVGMACRYPDADSPQALWENVLAQRRAFRRLPDERLNQADYVSADPDAPDTTYVTQAAVLKDYTFNRVKFRVAGDMFRTADLTHWLALDVAAEALADAGFENGAGLPVLTTGVVVGNTLTGEFSRAALMRLRWPYVRRVVEAALAQRGWTDQERRSFLEALEQTYKKPFPQVGAESLAGGLSNTIAGRICNYFDLKGGGYTVDGACASSLLSVAQACSALAAGDLDVALAGGVDLSLDPFELVGFARTGALARHAMRVYDARSAGFWPGEGCGFVVLMRQADALAQKRAIYALIRGWGISSDGSGGITRPETEGQILALARAYQRAGLDVGSVAYFEGHGTGTEVGDAAELQTLTRARRETRVTTPAAIGSVKANIGHTKAAAGLAGLIKASMALHTQVLPPTTGCERPHPQLVNNPQAAVYTLTQGRLWDSRAPLRAGVSAMGFGGINTHLVLENDAPTLRSQLTPQEQTLLHTAQDAELFLLAADDAATLQRQIDQWLRLSQQLSVAEMTDAAAYLARNLDPAAPLRAAVVAATPVEWAIRLRALHTWLAAGLTTWLDIEAGVFLGTRRQQPPRLAYLFPGQAAPAHADGGAWARRFPFAVARLAEVDTPAGADTTHTAIAQPAIVAASLIGLEALAHCGLTAEVAIGHSLGELTALHWAGALGAPAVLALARARGAAMGQLGDPSGAMLSISANRQTVEWLLGQNDSSQAVIACYNAPHQTIISGAAEAVERVAQRAAAQNLPTARLPVSHAFHSPLVAAASAPLQTYLQQHSFAPLQRPVISTVTGRRLPADTDVRDLLVRQVTAPVRFTQALQELGDAADLLIEVGPGRILGGLTRSMTHLPVVSLDVGSESLVGLLKAVGATYALGATLHPAALLADRFTRPFDPAHTPSFLVNPCELAPPSTTPGPEWEGGPTETTEAREHTPTPGQPQQHGTLNNTQVHKRTGATVGSNGATEAATDTPLGVVRRLVAERAELPLEAIGHEDRLLSDLHLNSITVSQLVGAAARQLGLAPPASPTSYADITVAGLAQALGERLNLEGRGERPPSSEQRHTPAARPEAPAGVEAWIRPFGVVWRADRTEEGPSRPAGETSVLRSGEALPAGKSGWHILAPADHPLAADLRRAVAARRGTGVIVCLPPEVTTRHIPLLLQAAQRALEERVACFVLTQYTSHAASIARTLFLEAGDDVAVCAITLSAALPLAQQAAYVLAEMDRAQGYTEVRYTADGRRERPVLQLLPLTDGPTATEEDDSSRTDRWRTPVFTGATGGQPVLLATGGGKGITAECALALGQQLSASLALVGRVQPEADAEVAYNLARMREAGLPVAYFVCDITRPEAVRALVQQVRAEMGEIGGVLHGAAINEPALLSQLDEAAFAKALAPKWQGLNNLLSTLPGDSLQLLITFGSIIGRSGLVGEAHYALANEWQTWRVEEFQAQHPHCRCLNLEWSVWADVGMGARLGRIDALAQLGVTPIPTAQGVAWLQRLVKELGVGQEGAPTGLPTSVVVMGRYGQMPTLAFDSPDLPLGRFLEEPRLYYPGVELIADAHLAHATDPYLAGHIVQGEQLLPGVLGLEAMAQAAMALQQTEQRPIFEEVVFERPIVVPRDGAPGFTGVTVRVVALARPPDAAGRTRVSVALRSQETGYYSDHFRATCLFRPADAAPPTPALTQPPPETVLLPPVPLSPATDLYHSRLLFQEGPFQQLRAYRHLTALSCVAEISVDPPGPWFGPYLPQSLMLGQPGARDAFIHAIQACIPHATLLPVKVERIVCRGLPPAGQVTLQAVERGQAGAVLIYDLVVRDGAGEIVEFWDGLHLHRVAGLSFQGPWAPALLGPSIERRLRAWLPGVEFTAAVEIASDTAPQRRQPAGINGTTARTEYTEGIGTEHPESLAPGQAPALHEADRLLPTRRERTNRALQRALGQRLTVQRRYDGKPELLAHNQVVSAAHAGGLTLALVSPHTVSCDVEMVTARSQEVWRDLLGPTIYPLTAIVGRELPESFDTTATRLWAVRECLHKAEVSLDAPLLFTTATEDGWALFLCGDYTIAAWCTQVQGIARPVVAAVLLRLKREAR